MLKTFHPLSKKIEKLFLKNNLWYEKFVHEPVITSLEAANIRNGYSIEQGAKALIVKIKKNKNEGKFVMLVLPANMNFDKDKVKEYFDIKNIRFATKEELFQITDGILPGGVPLFGNLFGIEVYMDNNIFLQEKVVFNAGDRRISLAMYSKDLPKINNCINIDII